MKKFIFSIWDMFSDKSKAAIISAFNTFVSAFALTLLTSIVAVGTLEWTTAFWGGLLLVALRAAFKAVVMQFTPVRLGGKKK